MNYELRITEKTKLTFMKKVLAFGFIASYFILYTSYFPAPINAQGFNVASTYLVTDTEAVNGDIMISGDSGEIVRSTVSYDSRLLGVLEDTPLLVLEDADKSKKAIIRAGDTTINVTNFNGDIKNGDLITSSPVAGKGMKAEESGYVMGVALADAALSDETVSAEGRQVRTGTVKIALKIEYAELTTAKNSNRFFNQLNSAFFKNVSDPEKFTSTIRYVLAGIIAIIAFAIGFFFMSRSISKAVEAIGRNPLAKKSIYFSIVFQLVVTIIGALVTIALTLVIVRF